MSDKGTQEVLPSKPKAAFHHPLGFPLYDSLAMDMHAMRYADKLQLRVAALEAQLFEAHTEQGRLLAEIERQAVLLISIGDYAHDRSTGPAVPDALWEIRAMAYEGEAQ